MAPPNRKRKATSSPSQSPSSTTVVIVEEEEQDATQEEDRVVTSSPIVAATKKQQQQQRWNVPFSSPTTITGGQQQRSILAYGKISKGKGLLERKVDQKKKKEAGGVVDGGGGGGGGKTLNLDDGEGTTSSIMVTTVPAKGQAQVQVQAQQQEKEKECLQPVVIEDGKERSKDDDGSTLEKLPHTPRKRIRTVTPRTPSSVTETRGKSLIERIREKEHRRSNLPPPPTKAEVERKTALERLPEIVSILACLCISTTHNDCDDDTPKTKTMMIMKAGRRQQQQRQQQQHQQQQKISFPLPVLIQHLQNSVRNPISREEGERTIRLLAEEVAPDWIGLITMGKVIAAVLNRGCQPGRSELKRRLDAAVLLGRDTTCERVVV